MIVDQGINRLIRIYVCHRNNAICNKLQRLIMLDK